jgi:hypothetical protein
MSQIEEKHFGKIIFPDQNLTVKDIWITITAKKIYVELPDPELNVTNWNVVWGVFNKLGTVSLIECGLSSQTHGIGGNARKLIVHKLVQGIHLENKYQTFIENIQLETETLNEWASYNVTKLLDISSISIDSLPQPVSIFQHQFQNFNIEMKLALRTSYSFMSLSIKRVFIIDISFANMLNIYDLYLFKNKLEQFILFITNEDPGIEILGYNKLGKQILGINKTLQPNRFTHSINLDYNTLKDKIASVLELWFEEIELGPLYELLLERKNNPDLSHARHFLNLSVGIESFHSKFIDKKKRASNHPAIVNRNKIKVLLESEPELLKFFKDESAYWSKIDFIERLRDLTPLFEYLTEGVFPFTIEELLDKIKRTRNKLAHEGKYLLHLTEFEVFLVGYTLEMVLKLLIINQLGLVECYEDLKSEANQNIKNYAKWNNYNQKTELTIQ